MRAVDLFAGAGGFSTGAAMAGARVLWAAVHELTAHGSTVSAGLCRWAGLDPNTGTELAARAAIKEQPNDH